MVRKISLAFFVIIFYSSAIFAAGAPYWSTNGEQVVAPSTTFVLEVRCVEDSAGGAYIFYRKSVSDTDRDIYAARIDSSGNLMSGWPVVVADTTTNLEHMEVAADGIGGAFVVFEDAGDGYLYAQHVDSSRTVWPFNYVLEDTQIDPQNARIVSAGTVSGVGRVVIVWQAEVPSGAKKIYLAVLDTDGACVEKDVATDAGDKAWPFVSYDSANDKAFICWQDGAFGGHDVVVQKYDVDSESFDYAGGGTTGIRVSTAGLNKYPCIVPDASGGALVAWEYQVTDGAQKDLLLRHIDSSGNVSGSDPLCDAAQDQRSVTFVEDGSGGALAVWEDYRNYVTETDDNLDIYAQRIDSSGSCLWTPANGIAVCNAVGVQKLGWDEGPAPQSLKKVGSNFIVGWDDFRRASEYSLGEIQTIITSSLSNASTLPADIYAQKLDSSGTAQYIVNGVPLTTAPQLQMFESICTDGSNGIISAWLDARGSTATTALFGSYSQRTTDIDPTISSVSPSVGLPGSVITISAQDSVLNGFGADPTIISDSVGYGTSSNFISIGAYSVPSSDVTWGVKSILVTTPDDLVAGEHVVEVMAYGSSKTSTFTVPSGGPVVSEVQFDGESYDEGDFIDPTPVISAKVESPYEGVSVASIDLDAGGTVISVPMTDYNTETKRFSYELSTALDSGTRTIKIRGTDSLGSTGDYYTYNVVVGGATTVVKNVAVLPTVVDFSAGVGTTAKAVNYATIAYELSLSVAVDIKLYSPEGAIAWSQSIAAGEEGAKVGYNEVKWYGTVLGGATAGNGIYPFQLVSSGKVVGRGKIVVFNSR